MVYEFVPIVNRGLVFHRIAFWHVGICALNVAWIFAFSYEKMVLQCVIIWAQLVCLFAVYIRIYSAPGKTVAVIRNERTWVEYACVYVPWALYTSWVLGASLISIFIAVGKQPEDSLYGGLAALAVAAFINIMVLSITRDVCFTGVNVWTFIAISYSQSSFELILGSSIVLAAVVGACAAVAWLWNILYMFPRLFPSTSTGNDLERRGSVHESML